MLNSKFWQGFFALGPIVGFILFFIGYFLAILTFVGNIQEIENSGEPPMAIFGGIGIILIAALLLALVSLGSLVFYIVHATQNPNLKQNNLLLVWILLFIFASGIGQLIYWIVEILGKKNSSE
ncbi:hypothetical protein SAMN04490243_0105 [Robiginitalea myxolifaciens]|uniref:Phospholipase_D-nuclease N-terminal n=1 Tax=Robiginitalea myxolifaciens TaxID=400055 RepID=A0A1I6FN23_9FLAO|nr:hypothetical protein [Robiginitalea myxolifaciens]SFR31278.1 hypothetical protein SAMN04490243_0105 [Robiginitalea myxolifaciens]